MDPCSVNPKPQNFKLGLSRVGTELGSATGLENVFLLV